MRLFNRISKILICFFVLIIICSGCSYKDLDNAINKRINPDENETVAVKQITENDMHFVKQGESIPDYYEYIDESGQNVYDGIKGLEYKINNVKIYKTIYDAKVDTNECDGVFNDQKSVWKNNKFILVDATAFYTGNKKHLDKKTMLYLDFFADYRKDDNYPTFKEALPNNSAPHLVYFSEHANDGDINVNTEEKMTKNEDYYMFRKSAKNGDTINFKLGIVVSDELVKQNNVFLFLHYSMPPANDPIYCVDLLGEFSNEKSN